MSSLQLIHTRCTRCTRLHTLYTCVHAHTGTEYWYIVSDRKLSGKTLILVHSRCWVTTSPGAPHYLLRGPLGCQFWLKPGGVWGPPGPMTGEWLGPRPPPPPPPWLRVLVAYSCCWKLWNCWA